MAFAHHQIVGSEVFKRLDLPSGYGAVRLTPARRPAWAGAFLVMLSFLVSSAMLTVAVLFRTGLLRI